MGIQFFLDCTALQSDSPKGGNSNTSPIYISVSLLMCTNNAFIILTYNIKISTLLSFTLSVYQSGRTENIDDCAISKSRY